MGAAQPETEGVVVGGVHPLSLRVNTGQALLVVLQELDGFLSDDAVSLRLHKGTDFSEVGVFCTQRQRHRLLCVPCVLFSAEAYKRKPGLSVTRRARGSDDTAIIGTAMGSWASGSLR